MTFYDKDAKEVDFIYIDEDGVSNEVNGTYTFEKRGSYIFEVDFNERIITCIYFEAIEEMEA